MLVKRKKRKNHYKKGRGPQGRGMGAPLAKGLKGVAGLLLVSFLSAGFVFGYDLLTQCAYFGAKRIEVNGMQRLDPSEVCRQAHVRPGVNIFHVNLSLARKRLLAHPWIRDAQVRRETPDAIIISIQEHTPLAMLDLGRKFLIDTRGEIFKEVKPADPQNLPVVSGLRFSDLNAAGQPPGQAYAAVLEVLKLGMDRHCVVTNRAIQKICVDREIGLTLFAFDRQTAIKLGYDNYPDKYIRLRNVLGYLNRRPDWPDVRRIDLNNVDRIVVHPVAAGTSADQKEV